MEYHVIFQSMLVFNVWIRVNMYVCQHPTVATYGAEIRRMDRFLFGPCFTDDSLWFREVLELFQVFQWVGTRPEGWPEMPLPSGHNVRLQFHVTRLLSTFSHDRFSTTWRSFNRMSDERDELSLSTVADVPTMWKSNSSTAFYTVASETVAIWLLTLMKELTGAHWWVSALSFKESNKITDGAACFPQQITQIARVLIRRLKS